ncbi:MAG: glyoxalase/bleomycin resistance/dioxygenase family protein [Chloroflexota bacterium]|nr:glyoxalase/bleomycin resistance/dioxygenase family protein [Chloroflexota bacterium]MDE2884435.1 glyoxalase/bleomycin resistance/dioxygenase family protein [Chloroflexota bacterium]
MSTGQNDSRPPVWVGHVSMGTSNLTESQTFMEQLGMRPMFRNESVAIFELRGGTHLVLVADADAQPGDAPFDLMVEDVEATHAEYAERGLEPSSIERGRIHASFTVTEPGGGRITVNSTHVSDLPV